jgi:RNA polymerase sigma-70 factor (ECF subfamily)
MSQDQSFDGLMVRLHAGDQDAATDVFHRYKNRLIALARSRLDGVRRKVDPEDVVDSVYKSFFVRVSGERIGPENWDSLWSLLAVITLRKCGHLIEYFHAACRDIGREQTSRPSAEESHRNWEAIAREPTPCEAAMLAETVQQLMLRFGTREREIAGLVLQGLSNQDISAQVPCSERTVRRVLARMKTLLESMRDENADGSQGSDRAKQGPGT